MNLFFICFFFALMTSKFKNTETTHWTPPVPLQCCSSRFQFHLLFFLFSIFLSVLSREGCNDLELPFCQLWNKQLQFSSSFRRPLLISFLSQLCSFVPVKGSTTMISRHNIWFWRDSTLPLVSPPNDDWETSAEIPFWWCVTTQIWLVTRHQTFLRRHLAGKQPVVASQMLAFFSG